MKQKPEKNTYNIPNVERAFAVLEVLAKSPRGAAFMDLLKTTKINKTTLFRILSTLEKTGYVVTSSEGGLFFLSRKIMFLAHSAFEDCNVAVESFEAMRKLRDNVGETVMLGTLIDDACVMVEQEVSLHDFNFSGKLGMKSPLHASAPGKAFLAFLPEESFARTIAKVDFKRYTPNTICTKEEILREISRIRNQGFSFDNGEVLEGLRCAAAPIFDSKGYPVAVIWITGPSHRIKLSDAPKFGKKVKDAAMEISLRLGFRRETALK